MTKPTISHRPETRTITDIVNLYERSAVETANLSKDGIVFVRVLPRVVDQASERLADIREAIGRNHLLEKFNLARLDLNRARTLIFHRRSPFTRSTWVDVLGVPG